jgi:hypothetical protein
VKKKTNLKSTTPYQNDELHAEAEDTAKVLHEYKLKQIVDGGVNPTPALGSESFKVGRDSCVTECLWHKHKFSTRKLSKHECR